MTDCSAQNQDRMIVCTLYVRHEQDCPHRDIDAISDTYSCIIFDSRFQHTPAVLHLHPHHEVQEFLQITGD